MQSTFDFQFVDAERKVWEKEWTEDRRCHWYQNDKIQLELELELVSVYTFHMMNISVCIVLCYVCLSVCVSVTECALIIEYTLQFSRLCTRILNSHQMNTQCKPIE